MLDSHSFSSLKFARDILSPAYLFAIFYNCEVFGSTINAASRPAGELSGKVHFVGHDPLTSQGHVPQ